MSWGIFGAKSERIDQLMKYNRELETIRRNETAALKVQIETLQSQLDLSVDDANMAHQDYVTVGDRLNKLMRVAAEVNSQLDYKYTTGNAGSAINTDLRIRFGRVLSRLEDEAINERIASEKLGEYRQGRSCGCDDD